MEILRPAALAIRTESALAHLAPRPIEPMSPTTDQTSPAKTRAGELRSERRLVRAAQRGSSRAIEGLFRMHWTRAYRAAYMVTRDAAAAEDIAQEAFLSAIRSLDRFDRRRRFGPWLHRIAVNRAIDWTRARKLRAEVGSPPPGDRARAVDETATDPRADSLDRALASLSPEQRAIVAMRFTLDLTPGEIASTLEIPRGTVNSKLRRSLDALATELEAQR